MQLRLQEEIEEGRRLHEALCEEIAPIAKDVLAKLQASNTKHALPESEYEITYEIFLSEIKSLKEAGEKEPSR